MRTAWREAFAMSDGGRRARSGLRSHVALSKVSVKVWESMGSFPCLSSQ